MGNLVYPANLPGLTFNSMRSPSFNTGVQAALSGKESRIAYQQYALMDFELTYELLRDYVTPSDLKSLVGLFIACQGKFDTFLYSDPVFNTVANQQFAVADGTSGPFQITATYQNSPVNLLTNSNNFFGWSGGILGITLAGSSDPSPDGTLNATRVTCTASSGPTYLAHTSISVTPSTTYTLSLYIRSPSGGAVTFGIDIQDGTTSAVLGETFGSATSSWQRISVTITTSSTASLIYAQIADGMTNGSVVEIYGAQLEQAATPSTYEPTTTQPQYGAGSPELIQNFNGTPLIYAGGTLQTINTTFSLSGTGGVTFTTGNIPASGTILTWTGSFYYRCRFDDDHLDVSQFMANFWEAKKVKLKQVKL